MSDDPISLQVAVVSKSEVVCDLLRGALSTASAPIEITAWDNVASALRRLLAGVDIAYLDGDLGSAEVSRLVAAARAAHKPGFTVILGEPTIEPLAADALADWPADSEEAKRLVERSIRVRLPSRVLIVDDSPTMRAIVRRLLEATRFSFEIAEADEGFAALDLTRDNAFDLVFLDHNMPGFSGLETLAEFRRERRRVNVVIMTSQEDGSLSDRARDRGAAFLKKPFFQRDIEMLLCRFYGLRALNPDRA
jgi:CheY-like chemotaxis protein